VLESERGGLILVKWSSVLLGVAVCCWGLQCVAERCSVLLGDTVCYCMLQSERGRIVPVWCAKCVAGCCSVLQRVAVCYRVLQRVAV